MTRDTPATRGSALVAVQVKRVGDASSAGAVSFSDYTMDPGVHSIWKAHTVDLLSELFEVEPALAIVWAHPIQARWPWFRGA